MLKKYTHIPSRTKPRCVPQPGFSPRSPLRPRCQSLTLNFSASPRLRGEFTSSQVSPSSPLSLRLRVSATKPPRHQTPTPPRVSPCSPQPPCSQSLTLLLSVFPLRLRVSASKPPRHQTPIPRPRFSPQPPCPQSLTLLLSVFPLRLRVSASNPLRHQTHIPTPISVAKISTRIDFPRLTPLASRLLPYPSKDFNHQSLRLFTQAHRGRP
jgi:hypothetical protein